MRFLRRSFTILVFLLVASSAHARTWFIAADGSGDAPTIQAGIDAASPGDTVLVGPGTYTGTSLHVATDIALLSRDGALATRLEGTDVVISVENVGASAVIHGFDLGLPDLGGWGCVDAMVSLRRSSALALSACVHLENSGCTISGNRIHGGYNGVEAIGSTPVIMENQISHCGVGINLTDTGAVVSNNEVLDCAECIGSFQGTPTISGNTVGGTTTLPCDGIAVGGPVSDTVHIAQNIIANVEDAIYVSGSAVIENNRITNCRQVYLNYAQNTALTGNILIDTVLDAQNALATIEQNTLVRAWILLGLGTFSRNLAYQSEVHCTLGITLSCNDSWGAATTYSGACAGVVGQNGNISVDPQFCGIAGSGNYYLQADSPCAPGHHPDGTSCGLIGAFDVGCGAVKTQPATWGAIKAMYRK